MGNASLLDVFNAATHVGNQALDIYSREKKYELDVKLYNEAADFQKVQDKLIADLNTPDADGNMAFLQNPGAYAGHVNKTIGEWVNKAARAGNNSRYYNDRLHELETQGRAAMNNRVVAATVKALNQQARITTGKQLTNIRNDERLTPEQKLEKGLATVRLAGQNNVYDAAEQYEIELDLVNDNWEQAGTYRDNGTDTTTQAQEAVKTKQEEYERIAREKHNINPDEYIKDKQIKVAAAQQAAKKSVQDRNYNNLDVAAKEWQQMINDYLEHAPGSENLFPKIVAGWLNGRAAVDAGTYGSRKSEYADEKKPAMQSMFRWDERLGDNPGGSGSQKPPDDYLKGLIYVGLRDVVQGNAKDAQKRGISIAQFFGEDTSALEYVWDAMEADAGHGNKLAQKYLEYYNKNGGKAAFYRDTVYTVLTEKEAILKELYEKDEANLAIWGIRDIKSTLTTIFEKGKMSAEEYGQLVSNAVSWINDEFDETVFGPGVNEQTFRNKINSFKTLLYAKSIPAFGISRFIGGRLRTVSGSWKDISPRANNEASMVEAIEALQKQVDVVWYEGNDENNVRFANPKIQKEVEDFRPEEQAFLESRTGKDDLRWVGYQKEEGKVADVIGLGVYEDLNGVQYKENVVDGKLKIQTRQRSANGTFGNWADIASTPSQTRAERAPVYTSAGQRRVALAEARDTWAPGATAPTGESQWGGDQYAMLGILERLARQDKPPANSGISPDYWNTLRNSGGTEALEIELLKVYGAGRR